MRMLIAVIATALFATPSAAKSIKVGEASPDFEITLIDKSKVTLADLRGQVVVLNFWATWCVPCRTELSLLDRYYDLTKKHGLRVFAVTTEGSLPLYCLKPLFEKMTIPAARKITGGYGALTGVPTNFIIDRKGVVRYAKSGSFELADLNRELIPLLKEPAPYAVSAATPGSSLPSIHSRKAPPAVETKVN